MPKLTVSADIEIEIDRPVEEVWAFVSDLTRLPEWLDEFEEVVQESPGPLAKGGVCSLHRPAWTPNGHS